MTHAEAVALKSFKNYCTCGGYAGLSERAKSRHPHMAWCPQRDEWEEWKAAMESRSSAASGEAGPTGEAE